MKQRAHRFELVKHKVALLLPLVSVDGCRPKFAGYAVAELVAHALGGTEDHDALAHLGAQDALRSQGQVRVS